MRQTKRRLEAFSFYDYTGIARHLASMAERGWLIEKMSNFGWVYRRIEPEKLSFAVAYFPKASEFDPEPTEAQREFHAFCEHTGWVLAASLAQMQVFYNRREDPVPLETDPLLEIETIHAAAKRSYLPAWWVLLAISVLDSALFVSRLLGDWIGLLASATNLFTGFGWLMLLLLCGMELGGYFAWRRKALQTAERGERPETRSHTRAQKGILAAVLVFFAYWLLSTLLTGSALLQAVTLGMLGAMTALYLLVNGVKELLKRKKAPRGLNRSLTLLASFLLSFTLMGLVTSGILRLSQNGFFDLERESYRPGATIAAYLDQPPLTVEDLMDVPGENYVCRRQGDESLLLGQLSLRQLPTVDRGDGAGLPQLSYTVVLVKLPLLYGPCRDSFLKGHRDIIEDGQIFADHYEPVDAAPWRAREAYRLRWSAGAQEQYLLFYDMRIVEILFSWSPTEAQMSAVGERLGG